MDSPIFIIYIFVNLVFAVLTARYVTKSMKMFKHRMSEMKKIQNKIDALKKIISKNLKSEIKS